MTALAAILSRHIDQPDQRHRLVLLDPTHLRCHDCARTILLTQPSSSTSTSPSPIPGPHDPICPTHGRYAGTCRGCAADTKADETRRQDWTPTADVTARAAEARAALPPRTPTPTRPTPPDPQRMAQARTELNALRQTETTNA